MDRTVVKVELPNGVTALVRAVDAGGGGAAKAARTGKPDLSAVMGTLEGMSLAVKSALAKAAPDKVAVEFGLELAVKAGALTAMLVDGEGSASLRVTLEWQGDDGSGRSRGDGP
ncbi:MAG TPA: CU044_2847 family protein [Streptosporangiaceae bacterium]|nr:CU044_2847 family protein [Streptosporangiaceae bacterium]